MKKLLITTMLGVTLFTSAFASSSESVSNRTKRTFENEFKKPNAVDWSIKSGFNTATFMENGIRTQAFFDYDGTLVATCKNVDFNALPENTRYSFDQRYQGYTIKEVISYDDRNQFSYFVSLENEKETLILKVSSGYLSVFEKHVKN